MDTIQPPDELLSIVSSRRQVPNEFPFEEPRSIRIALVGEAPGETEENYRRPFVGKSGQFLNAILRDVGINRLQTFLGNICQFRPPANRISAFEWTGVEIQDGLNTLRENLRVFNPNICVLMGNTPMRAARGPCKISDWRGSLFICTNPTSPFYGRKCIGTLHPAFVLREFSGFPLLKFDLSRAKQEAGSPELTLPTRELITNLSAGEISYVMDTWPKGQRCSIDIEGGLPIDMVNVARLSSKGKYTSRFGWPCVSICARPTKSFTIVWNRFSPHEHGQVLQSFARLMERRDVPKVLQNQLSDNFKLSYGFGIYIANVVEDVMIKGWEIYAELPRALAVQASVWTRQPHWKDDSMYDADGEGLYRGCAIDTAVTLEICNAQDQVMTGQSLIHYHKMIEIQNPFLYMELRGIKYDLENVAKAGKENDKKLLPVRERITQNAGRDLCGPKGSLSAKKLIEALYVTKKLPPQYKKEFGRKTEVLTSDVEALLTLKRATAKVGGPTDDFLSDVLLHRHLEGVRETLNITADADGRVRCGYSLEAETGRVKCYTSPTGSGANLQTIQKTLRPNYVADLGMEFFQCDLEGADGWTVACRCAALGDHALLNDYLAGMKPAKIIALLYVLGSEINQLDQESLKFAHDNIFPIILEQEGKWLYLGCKRVQHGSSYLMGIVTMVLNVLKDSYKESGKPIYLDHSAARTLQNYLFLRYRGLALWHTWAESKLVSDGKLTAASGHTRVFFGRRLGRDIKDTVKEFLAHEPQNNTTWATNLAMLNLWNDPENRRADGSLIIEPLHQVHDALCGQWPINRRDWACSKVRSYFRNKLTIAGREITIPFEGNYGPGWENWIGKI